MRRSCASCSRESTMDPIVSGGAMGVSGKIIVAIGLVAVALFPGCRNTIHGNTVKDDVSVTARNPEPSDPIIGVGDTVEVSVYRNDDLKKSVKVDKSGKMMFPLIGDIKLVDRTIYSVREELQTRLGEYLVNPQVSIMVTTVLSQKILVLGEVKSPGSFTLDLDLSIAEAVLKAGGSTVDAKLTDIYVIRRPAGTAEPGRKPELFRFDMKTAIQTGNFASNILLKNGDIVYVPTREISDVSRFMTYVASIISPIVTMETGIVLWPQTLDVLKGNKSSTNFSVPTN